ncbi:MAG: DUF2059 domain-containing protein [Rhodospirillales bacterium]
MRRLTSAAMSAAFIFAAAAVFTPGAESRAQDSASKRAAAERLVEITNLDLSGMIAQMIEPVIRGMMQGITEENPNIPARAVEIMGEEFTQLFRSVAGDMSSQMTEQIVSLSMKYYTEDEINAVTAFHESPVGQKQQALMPDIMHEVMQLMSGAGAPADKCAGVTAERCAAAERLVNSPAVSGILDILPPETDRQMMLDWSVAVYAKYFTVGDMTAVAAFYETPAGKKSAEMVRPIIQDISVWLQTALTDIMGREIPLAMERMKNRIEAEGLTNQ